MMKKILANKKMLNGVAAGGVLLALCLLLYFVHFPLWREVKEKKAELAGLNSKLNDARTILDSFKKTANTKKLLPRKKISYAIDELTRIGTSYNISFISMSPEGVVNAEGTEYSVMPIALSMVGSYEDIGKFIGALEQSDQIIAAVSHFDLAENKINSGKINANMVINLYLQKLQEDV
ncbi:MAG: type 4a pilus biogenesis protein PilO [Candidatus Omnitrophota bacterium]